MEWTIPQLTELLKLVTHHKPVGNARSANLEFILAELNRTAAPKLSLPDLEAKMDEFWDIPGIEALEEDSQSDSGSESDVANKTAPVGRVARTRSTRQSQNHKRSASVSATNAGKRASRSGSNSASGRVTKNARGGGPGRGRKKQN